MQDWLELVKCLNFLDINLDIGQSFACQAKLVAIKGEPSIPITFNRFGSINGYVTLELDEVAKGYGINVLFYNPDVDHFCWDEDKKILKFSRKSQTVDVLLQFQNLASPSNI